MERGETVVCDWNARSLNEASSEEFPAAHTAKTKMKVFFSSWTDTLLQENLRFLVPVIMISVRYFIMWCVSVGTCSVSADPVVVSAREGSTVLLPCDWSNVPVQTPHVQWSTVSETVFERKGAALYQGERYEGRVDVPQDKLLKGNCSLVLRNVRLADAGVYESYLHVKRASSTKWLLVQWLKLSVEETPEETSQDVSDPSETPEEKFSDWKTADAGVNGPRPHILLLSLLSSLRVLYN